MRFAAVPLVALSFAPGSRPEHKVVTLLFTNDVESAYDPIPAFWRNDLESIGGIAEMTTLIRDLRKTEPNTFLFDSGDIFTGSTSRTPEKLHKSSMRTSESGLSFPPLSAGSASRRRLPASWMVPQRASSEGTSSGSTTPTITAFPG